MFKEAFKNEIGEDKWEWILTSLYRTPEYEDSDKVARILTAALEAGFELPKDSRWPNEIRKANMNASDAKKLNLKYIAEQVVAHNNNQTIDQKIKDAASKGGCSVSVDIIKFEKQIRAPFFDTIKAEYEIRGFKVTRDKGSDSDYYGSSSWDYIRISW